MKDTTIAGSPCSCDKHDWMLSHTVFDDDRGYGGGGFIYHYICKRCKKKMSSRSPLGEHG